MNTGTDRLNPVLSEQLARWRAAFGLFRFRTWLISILGAVFTLVLIALPTALFDNPFFTRMIPARPQDYIIWILSGILAGLIIGTYSLGTGVSANGKAVTGGFLSFLAVGCPVCNKLVLLALGTSGALTFFAPAQLYLGIASVALLGWALHLRVKSISQGCRVDEGQVRTAA